MLGLNGAPAHPVRNAILFGTCDLTAVWHGIATAPIFGWELSLGLCLVVECFHPSPITTGMAATGTATPYQNTAR